MVGVVCWMSWLSWWMSWLSWLSCWACTRSWLLVYMLHLDFLIFIDQVALDLGIEPLVCSPASWLATWFLRSFVRPCVRSFVRSFVPSWIIQHSSHRHHVVVGRTSHWIPGELVSFPILLTTLSPIIMVQWKIGPLNERKLILEEPIFHFHDYGRKGRCSRVASFLVGFSP